MTMHSSPAANSPPGGHDGPNPDLAGALAILIQSIGWGEIIAFMVLLLALRAAVGIVLISLRHLKLRINR